MVINALEPGAWQYYSNSFSRHNNFRGSCAGTIQAESEESHPVFELVHFPLPLLKTLTGGSLRQIEQKAHARRWEWQAAGNSYRP